MSSHIMQDTTRKIARSAPFLFLAFLLFPLPPAFADDWPQWRGPHRDGVWREDGILESFPEDGLDVVWRTPIASGYSGPVVAHGRVYTMDYRPKPETRILEAIERLLCLDEQTGEILWTHEWETHYRDLMHSYATGPRASPAVADGRVFAIGSAGSIVALDAETGEPLWSYDAREDFGTPMPIWGTATSPLVDGDRVVFATGGDSNDQLKAFNVETGEILWSALSTDYELGYSQPVIIEAAGVRQLLMWDPKALHALNPQTGESYWSVPMDVGQNMAIATPVRSGPHVLVSCFYSGSMLVELNGETPTAEKLWHIEGKGVFPNQTRGLHAVITTPVIQGDYFYGTDSYGEFRCLSLQTGERVWTDDTITRQGRWGSAFLVRHGERYFMNNDKGELLILTLSPEGPTVIDRAPLIEPTTDSGFGPGRFFSDSVNWVHPAYANRHLVTRNDEEIIRVSLEAPLDED